MTSTVMFGILLVAVVRSTFSEFVNVGQNADGSSDFKYFSTEAEKVAKELLTFLPNVDGSMKKYVTELKHSSSVANALNKYNAWVKSAKGTHCAVYDDVTRAQDKIDTIVDTCVATASKKDIDDLKKVIKKGLIKDQIADNNLRQNAEACSSQDAVPSSACAEEKIIALKSINSIFGKGGRAHYNYFLRNAFFNFKLKVGPCVDIGAKGLQESLEAATKRIQKCMAT